MSKDSTDPKERGSSRQLQEVVGEVNLKNDEGDSCDSDYDNRSKTVEPCQGWSDSGESDIEEEELEKAAGEGDLQKVIEYLKENKKDIEDIENTENINIITKALGGAILNAASQSRGEGKDFKSVIEVLLESSSDAQIKTITPHGINRLIEENVLEITKLLLDAGVNIGENNNGNTPLNTIIKQFDLQKTEGVEAKSLEIIQKLLEMGAKDTKSAYEKVLYIVAKNGNPDISLGILRTLGKKNIDTKAKDYAGKIPLCYAIEKEASKAIIEILSQGVSHQEVKRIKLFDFINKGKLEKIEEFLKDNSDIINKKDHDGNTTLNTALNIALNIAIGREGSTEEGKAKNFKIAEKLLEKGEPPNKSALVCFDFDLTAVKGHLHEALAEAIKNGRREKKSEEEVTKEFIQEIKDGIGDILIPKGECDNFVPTNQFFRLLTAVYKMGAIPVITTHSTYPDAIKEILVWSFDKHIEKNCGADKEIIVPKEIAELRNKIRNDNNFIFHGTHGAESKVAIMNTAMGALSLDPKTTAVLLVDDTGGNIYEAKKAGYIAIKVTSALDKRDQILKCVDLMMASTKSNSQNKDNEEKRVDAEVETITPNTKIVPQSAGAIASQTTTNTIMP